MMILAEFSEAQIARVQKQIIHLASTKQKLQEVHAKEICRYLTNINILHRPGTIDALVNLSQGGLLPHRHTNHH